MQNGTCNHSPTVSPWFIARLMPKSMAIEAAITISGRSRRPTIRRLPLVYLSRRKLPLPPLCLLDVFPSSCAQAIIASFSSPVEPPAAAILLLPHPFLSFEPSLLRAGTRGNDSRARRPGTEAASPSLSDADDRRRSPPTCTTLEASPSLRD